MKTITSASEAIIEVPKLDPIPALPDKSKDEKVSHAIQSILAPSEIKIDEALLCPITYGLFRDPVCTADGHTYERQAITEWLSKHNTSPRTNLLLEHKKLTPNHLVKSIVEDFLEKNPGLKDSAEDIPKDLISELSTACIRNDQQQIKKLAALDQRLLVHAFETFKGQTALHFAVSDPQSLDTVVGLLEKRYTGLALAGLLRPNSEGLLPIHESIGRQNTQMLLKLSMWMGEKIALVSAPPKWPHHFNNRTLDEALAWSVSRGDLEKTRCFLRLGANPQAKTAKGETRVYQAVKIGSYDCLMALLEAKADPNLDDLRLDDTPLHCAVRVGTEKVSAALIRAGARLDKQLANGFTPLHHVAQDYPVEMLDILLDGKQELPKKILEAQDKDGCTALHCAAISDRVDNVAWLLKHKANPLSVVCG
jgi:ankyrin repeat protein